MQTESTDMKSELTTIKVESVNYRGEKDGVKKWWEEIVCPFFWPKMAKVELDLNHPLENLTEKLKKTSADTTETIRDELKNQHQELKVNIQDSLDELIEIIQKDKSTNSSSSEGKENGQENIEVLRKLAILEAQLLEARKIKNTEIMYYGKPSSETIATIARLEFEINRIKDK